MFYISLILFVLSILILRIFIMIAGPAMRAARGLFGIERVEEALPARCTGAA
ncbi:MAG: hypothetical protein ACJARR_002607 [Pseudophaeobacter arcticus]|jgi:hypothetical protein